VVLCSDAGSCVCVGHGAALCVTIGYGVSCRCLCVLLHSVRVFCAGFFLPLCGRTRLWVGCACRVVVCFLCPYGLCGFCVCVLCFGIACSRLDSGRVKRFMLNCGFVSVFLRFWFCLCICDPVRFSLLFSSVSLYWFLVFL